jgi:hypothetical protein
MSFETYGAQACKVYFVTESTYGVCPTSPSLLGINTEGPEPKIDPSLIEVLGIGSRDLQALYRGLQKVQLKVPGILSPTAPTSLLQYAGQIPLSSLSVLVAYYQGQWASPSSVIAHMHSGCKLNKATVSAKVDDIVKADFEFMGQSISRSTSLPSGATYGDYPNGIPFYNVPVQQGAATGGSYSTLTDVQEWKFEIDNNLKPVGVISSAGTAYMLKYLVERNRKLTGELTLEFESDWALQNILNDQLFSLNFNLPSSHAVLFTNCKWADWDPKVKIKDLVDVDLKFTAGTVAIT